MFHLYQTPLTAPRPQARAAPAFAPQVVWTADPPTGGLRVLTQANQTGAAFDLQVHKHLRHLKSLFPHANANANEAQRAS